MQAVIETAKGAIRAVEEAENPVQNARTAQPTSRVSGQY